jgi:aminoglycoside phosphotransferase (APT) family kinase protein
VIAEFNERSGAGLRFVGMADDGDSGGAAFVEWPDGRPGVLTRPSASAADMRLAAGVLEMAGARGLPVPRHELIVELAAGPAVVQERLPGRPHHCVDAVVIDEMVAMNDRFADLLVDRPEVPVADMRDDDRAYDYVAEHSDRARRLIERIRELDAEIPHEMLGNDLVHLDYARGNILFDENGRITGVVDWNAGVVRGDRDFALVWLRSDLEWREQSAANAAEIDGSAVERLDKLLDERIEPVLLCKYWAFWTMRRLPPAIWRNESDVLEVFLRLGEERLGLT